MVLLLLNVWLMLQPLDSHNHNKHLPNRFYQQIIVVVLIMQVEFLQTNHYQYHTNLKYFFQLTVPLVKILAPLIQTG